jgi:hypothetical protein
MKLPQTTQPPKYPTARRHNPSPTDAKNYQRHKPCLRWDFGFTCPFCLLHETDFAPLLADRLGIFTVEHRLLQSTHPEARGDYQNCLYACRLYNLHRKADGLEDQSGRKLLDPTAVAWFAHFQTEGDALNPRQEDKNASYTWEAYGLNDSDKVMLRKNRRERIHKLRESLLNGPAEIEALLQIATETQAPLKAKRLMSLVKTLEQQLEEVRRELGGFRAIPGDADSRCRCGTTKEHRLPLGLAEQMHLDE